MSIPPSGTIIGLLIFILIAFIPPRLPLFARIGLQVVLGLGIYFGMSHALFALPNGDNLPMSDLYGGAGDLGTPFNKYAYGLIAPVLGILFSLIAAVIRKLMGKKGDA